MVLGVVRAAPFSLAGGKALAVLWHSWAFYSCLALLADAVRHMERSVRARNERFTRL